MIERARILKPRLPCHAQTLMTASFWVRTGTSLTNCMLLPVEAAVALWANMPALAPPSCSTSGALHGRRERSERQSGFASQEEGHPWAERPIQGAGRYDRSLGRALRPAAEEQTTCDEPEQREIAGGLGNGGGWHSNSLSSDCVDGGRQQFPGA